MSNIVDFIEMIRESINEKINRYRDDELDFNLIPEVANVERDSYIKKHNKKRKQVDVDIRL